MNLQTAQNLQQLIDSLMKKHPRHMEAKISVWLSEPIQVNLIGGSTTLTRLQQFEFQSRTLSGRIDNLEDVVGLDEFETLIEFINNKVKENFKFLAVA